MKEINHIHINDVPLGMMIINKKNDKFYIATINTSGHKDWLLCTCPKCYNQKGGNDTTLSPSPEQHSWHHHHAPFYQVFNNYVCLKRDTLGEMRDFIMELFSRKNYLERKAPFSN